MARRDGYRLVPTEVNGQPQPGYSSGQALDAMERHLVSERDGIIRLLTPAFDRTPHDPGACRLTSRAFPSRMENRREPRGRSDDYFRCNVRGAISYLAHG